MNVEEEHLLIRVIANDTIAFIALNIISMAKHSIKKVGVLLALIFANARPACVLS
jgi:hypothetical protein